MLYTDPVNGDRARTLFESVMRQRLERLGSGGAFAVAAVEEETAVARGLQHLLRAKPTMILIASTTAPAGPADVIGPLNGPRGDVGWNDFLLPSSPAIFCCWVIKTKFP